MMNQHIAIIIPTLNEARTIRPLINMLQTLRQNGHRVIVADGGSEDGTVRQLAPLVDEVVEAPRGRARQMNAGAGAATGPLLLFLHADTRLPEAADALIIESLKRMRRSWGRFDVRIDGRHPLLRAVERLMNARSRLTGIATGDQAIFVTRALFTAIGGFPDMPLMEDVELSRRLKRFGAPLCLHHRIVTSGRRWEKRGVLRTILLMWGLRLAYWLGVDPHRLAVRYGDR